MMKRGGFQLAKEQPSNECPPIPGLGERQDLREPSHVVLERRGSDVNDCAEPDAGAAPLVVRGRIQDQSLTRETSKIQTSGARNVELDEGNVHAQGIFPFLGGEG